MCMIKTIVDLALIVGLIGATFLMVNLARLSPLGYAIRQGGLTAILILAIWYLVRHGPGNSDRTDLFFVFFEVAFWLLVLVLMFQLFARISALWNHVKHLEKEARQPAYKPNRDDTTPVC